MGDHYQARGQTMDRLASGKVFEILRQKKVSFSLIILEAFLLANVEKDIKFSLVLDRQKKLWL